MITTLKEINMRYWTRKGFTPLREVRFEGRTAGSASGFSSLEMYRDHVL